MKRHLSMLALLCAAVLGLPGCGGGPAPAANSGGGAQPDKGAKRTIAVIPKSTSHEFWKQVEAGALSAAQGKNYELIFKAGEPGDDANAQLILTERLMAQGADAVVLAPVHSKFLVQAVEKAFEKKIPMVIIDSGVDVDFSKYTAFVATDNGDGGAQCARRLGTALGGKGTVLLLRYEAGSASTMERERGFTETLAKEFPGIKIGAEKYAGATRESSLKNANELLAANPGFDGVFACNESSSFGMLLALREKGLTGKVKFVGFDTAKELVEAVEKGEIEALAAQDPFMIGAQGVTQAINALEGRKADSIVIPAIMKDKAYFQKERADEAAKAATPSAGADEKKNSLEVQRLKDELVQLTEEQRAKLAAEEEKQKLLSKEDEQFKLREAEIKRLKEALDRQTAEQHKKIEAEVARQNAQIKAQEEEQLKRDAEAAKTVIVLPDAEAKKLAAEQARQKALEAQAEEQEKKRVAEIKRIQDEDAAKAAELDAKLAAEKQKRETLLRKQEDDDRKLAEEVKRIAEENKRKEDAQRKLLEAAEKAGK